jgi:arginyl-tRNA synthetase
LLIDTLPSTQKTKAAAAAATTRMSENDQAAKGASKNQLKKEAKKAAAAAKKAALKQQGTGGETPPPAVAAATTPATPVAKTPAPAPSAAPIPKPPKILLYQAAKDDAATLKAVWAAMHNKVDVGVAKSKDVPPGCPTASSGSKKPVLIYGQDYVLGGGGNAMVQAIALIGGEAPSFEADEWCELEKSTLRGGPLKLDSLATALEASATGVHLVGESDSMADICVLVALHTYLSSAPVDAGLLSWPTPVQKYYKCHLSALVNAQSEMERYLPAPPVSMDDPSLVKVLTSIFTAAIEELFPQADIPSNIVKKSATPKHGDYQVSAAMPIFASLKGSGNLPEHIKGPPQLAQAIVDHVMAGENQTVISEIRLQGPGFMMCKISPAYLDKQLQSVLTTQTLPKPSVAASLQGQTCLVDFSSPNIAKEMHVGHLRSTIIGESVCRILEFVGFKVERVNHVGDWGTQFGMLIQYLKEEYPDFAESMPNITDLTGFYKAAKKRFDDDPDFKKTSQLNVVDLQAGNEECTAIWKILCDVSRKEFQKVYDRLDVTVHEYGESFYNDKIPAVIDEFSKAGLLSVEEGGAKCVFVDDIQVPLMLQKSDGGYGYDSTDMAALKYRLQTVGASRIIVITDFSQGNHFVLCNRAAHMIGWVDKGQQLQHIGFGTVMGEDGQRFKTRSGETVRLVDLLDEAVNRMSESLRTRIQDGTSNIGLDDVHETAEAIGYGAVKYFDLKRNPTTNYKFSYDAMLDTEGDTAVYLLYARARFESIIDKAKAEHGVDVDELIKSGEKIVIVDDAERHLALQIQNFADTIELTLDDLFPYHVCNYVYDVAVAGSKFVSKCRVLGSDEMKSRLLLCRATTLAMSQCFDLLGIRHVKRI